MGFLNGHEKWGYVPTRVSMQVIETIVSKLGYNLFTGRIQPTFIGIIIHLLSTMDIPVGFQTPGVWRYLDPKNIPKTPSQEVFGRLGHMLL